MLFYTFFNHLESLPGQAENFRPMLHDTSHSIRAVRTIINIREMHTIKFTLILTSFLIFIWLLLDFFDIWQRYLWASSFGWFVAGTCIALLIYFCICSLLIIIYIFLIIYFLCYPFRLLHYVSVDRQCVLEKSFRHLSKG
jgi:hypothetical protein